MNSTTVGIRLVGAALVLSAIAGCQTADGTDARTAPLLDGMGALHYPISTSDTLAQRYFNQGLVLSYAFNHAEAQRSFEEAARLDTECAMCYWGAALVMGPNINAGMDDANVESAYEAIQKAVERAHNASAKEAALIGALAKRYAPAPVDDRTPLDSAYANAMRDLAATYPDDADVQTLFAESLMDLSPWDYWTDDGEPRPSAAEFLSVLTHVMETAPDNPGANHLYIHAVETEFPGKGVAAAERLEGLAPGAGHLVHMPGHIYIRVGRYNDAVLANQRAIQADESYSTQCHAQGLYPLAYMPHNHHFLWAAAALSGQSELGLSSAQAMAENTDLQVAREPGLGTLQHYWVTPLYAMVRFGEWDEILATPQPDDDLMYPRGVWQFARGMALVRRGGTDGAEVAADALAGIITNPAIDAVTVWDINASRALLEIAEGVLRGEIALEQGDHDAAVAHFEQAVAMQDNLNYDEPPPWPMSVRHNLGAALLEASKPIDAERVYRRDLAEFPENGWSLMGLALSLEAQRQSREAREVRERFEKAWQFADIEIDGSRR